MDISQYNTRVLKEPRGMIRIIQLVFAILAFATTSGFDTTVSFRTSCSPDSIVKTIMRTIDYTVEYPFKFKGQQITVLKDCNTNGTTIKEYDMEFSSSAQFYVATGVLSFLFTTACLVLYIFGAQYYETNPLIPVIDMIATGVLFIFWLSGACAWAAGFPMSSITQNPNISTNNWTYVITPTTIRAIALKIHQEMDII